MKFKNTITQIIHFSVVLESDVTGKYLKRGLSFQFFAFEDVYGLIFTLIMQ